MTVSKAKAAAFSAALQAGKYIKERRGKIKKIDYKGAFNIVTDVDKASEKMILEILKADFPDDSYVAEEGGGHEASKTNRRWYVDPLDGTTNFTHSYPFFCVSIGMEEAGQMMLGVVCNPIADELFYAERGKGAFLNDEPISVSGIGELNHSLLATGFPPDTGVGQPHNNMVPFTTLTNLSHGVRRDGSAALDLCFVACGRLEGFWEPKLAPWDIAAGSLIVEEAGGRVSDLTDGPLDMPTGHILATNKLIHAEVVAEMKKLDLK
ncbi:MAG: inositol monophosphatase family protein [Candidatus Obscuribacterales bacterium]